MENKYIEFINHIKIPTCKFYLGTIPCKEYNVYRNSLILLDDEDIDYIKNKYIPKALEEEQKIINEINTLK